MASMSLNDCLTRADRKREMNYDHDSQYDWIVRLFSRPFPFLDRIANFVHRLCTARISVVPGIPWIGLTRWRANAGVSRAVVLDIHHDFAERPSRRAVPRASWATRRRLRRMDRGVRVRLASAGRRTRLARDGSYPAARRSATRTLPRPYSLPYRDSLFLSRRDDLACTLPDTTVPSHGGYSINSVGYMFN